MFINIVNKLYLYIIYIDNSENINGFLWLKDKIIIYNKIYEFCLSDITSIRK